MSSTERQFGYIIKGLSNQVTATNASLNTVTNSAGTIIYMQSVSVDVSTNIQTAYPMTVTLALTNTAVSMVTITMDTVPNTVCVPAGATYTFQRTSPSAFARVI